MVTVYGISDRITQVHLLSINNINPTALCLTFGVFISLRVILNTFYAVVDKYRIHSEPNTWMKLIVVELPTGRWIQVRLTLSMAMTAEKPWRTAQRMMTSTVAKPATYTSMTAEVCMWTHAILIAFKCETRATVFRGLRLTVSLYASASQFYSHKADYLSDHCQCPTTVSDHASKDEPLNLKADETFNDSHGKYLFNSTSSKGPYVNSRP